MMYDNQARRYLQLPVRLTVGYGPVTTKVYGPFSTSVRDEGAGPMVAVMQEIASMGGRNVMPTIVLGSKL